MAVWPPEPRPPTTISATVSRLQRSWRAQSEPIKSRVQFYPRWEAGRGEEPEIFRSGISRTDELRQPLKPLQPLKDRSLNYSGSGVQTESSEGLATTQRFGPLRATSPDHH